MRLIDPESVSGRDRYELLTSLVVPRPIGWISTWGADDTANLAPFSYFCALSSSPMLVGVSIGERRGGPKDTLVNIRIRRAFCVNVVTERLLEAMNTTSANVGPEVDEFELAGLDAVPSVRVSAPYVEACPAVLECELQQEVSLGDAPNTLLIGRVVGVLLHSDLALAPGTSAVDSEALRPVGRLWGSTYALPGEVRSIVRPD